MRQEIEAHTLTTHQVDKIGAKCLVVEEQIDSIEVLISFSDESAHAARRRVHLLRHRRQPILCMSFPNAVVRSVPAACRPIKRRARKDRERGGEEEWEKEKGE